MGKANPLMGTLAANHGRNLDVGGSDAEHVFGFPLSPARTRCSRAPRSWARVARLQRLWDGVSQRSSGGVERTMPKISAPTVKEHREAVQTKLVDAAEVILRNQGLGELTAGAVTAQAGIARNSIYRYVESVNDLRGLVLARYLPRWMAAVDAQVGQHTDPRARVLEWVRANLEQASVNGHGWLMAVARSTRIDHSLRADLDSAHESADFLGQGLAELGLVNMPIRAGLIRAIVDAGFRSLDEGESLEDVTHWAEVAVTAIIEPSEASGDLPR